MNRQYNYNINDVQHLFIHIIKSLSSSEPAHNMISSILERICQHFTFHWGFVYEADYTGKFILQERFSSDANTTIDDSFLLEDHLSSAEIEDMLHSSIYFKNFDNFDDNEKNNSIFTSNTVIIIPIIDDNNKIVGLVGMVDRRKNIIIDEHDIYIAKMTLNLLGNHIKLRISQKYLEYAQQTLMSILDNSGVDVYVNDFFTHDILYMNKSMAEPYGGFENMINKKCYQVLYTDKPGQCEYCPAKRIIDGEGNPTKRYSWDYQRPFDGSWFRVLSAAFRWFDGRLAHIVSSVDITENKKNEQIIAQMANYDALTNLPNRRKLYTDYKENTQLLKSDRDIAYLLFFDLDKFKKLNDTMGHQAGDELLIQIGSALMRHPLTKDHIYRHAGDEFILFYWNVDIKYIYKAVDFLLNRFEQPWNLQNISPICRTSIGIASYPDDGMTLDDLLHSADQMMYKAKQSGGGMACFTDGKTVKPLLLRKR